MKIAISFNYRQCLLLPNSLPLYLFRILSLCAGFQALVQCSTTKETYWVQETSMFSCAHSFGIWTNTKGGMRKCRCCSSLLWPQEGSEDSWLSTRVHCPVQLCRHPLKTMEEVVFHIYPLPVVIFRVRNAWIFLSTSTWILLKWIMSLF